jgi:hypothetical protein
MDVRNVCPETMDVQLCELYVALLHPWLSSVVVVVVGGSRW